MQTQTRVTGMGLTRVSDNAQPSPRRLSRCTPTLWAYRAYRVLFTWWSKDIRWSYHARGLVISSSSPNAYDCAGIKSDGCGRHACSGGESSQGCHRNQRGVLRTGEPKTEQCKLSHLIENAAIESRFEYFCVRSANAKKQGLQLAGNIAN